MRSESELGRRRVALTVITATTPTLVRPTAIMARIGLWAEPSLAPAPGMDGVVRGVGAAGVGVVVGAGATDVATAGADMDSLVAAALRTVRSADSVEHRVASTALADFMAEVDSMEAADFTVEVVVSTVVALDVDNGTNGSFVS